MRNRFAAAPQHLPPGRPAPDEPPVPEDEQPAAGAPRARLRHRLRRAGVRVLGAPSTAFVLAVVVVAAGAAVSTRPIPPRTSAPAQVAPVTPAPAEAAPPARAEDPAPRHAKVRERRARRPQRRDAATRGGARFRFRAAAPAPAAPAPAPVAAAPAEAPAQQPRRAPERDREPRSDPKPAPEVPLPDKGLYACTRWDGAYFFTTSYPTALSKRTGENYEVRRAARVWGRQLPGTKPIPLSDSTVGYVFERKADAPDEAVPLYYTRTRRYGYFYSIDPAAVQRYGEPALAGYAFTPWG